MTRTSLGLALIAVLVAAPVGLGRNGAPRADACTGGLYDFQSAAETAGYIFIGDAVEVGDAINREPTLTPVPTTTSVPGSIPVSPPIARQTIDVQVDLTGIGERFRIVRSIVGTARDEISADQDTRRWIEREIRIWNGTGSISDCEIDRGAFRYALGARYLVFAAADTENGIITQQRYRITGEDALIDDPGADSYVPFAVTREIYDDYFRGIASQPYGALASVEIIADRMPLASLLRAVAAIRGDPSIAPPDTGSAGLASNRR